MNIRTWNYEINNLNFSDIFSNFDKNKSWLLQIHKKNTSFLEKIVHKIARFHFNNLNIDFNNDYYIEFSILNKNINKEFNIFTKKSNDKLIKPILNTITYFNDNYEEPTIITNITENMYKFKKIEDIEIYFSFPKKYTHISFDGGKYYNMSCNLNNELNNESNQYLIINLWEKKPDNIDYYKEEQNSKTLDLDIKIIEKKIKNEYYYNSEIFDYDFFDEFLYDNKNILITKLLNSFPFQTYENIILLKKYDETIKVSEPNENKETDLLRLDTTYLKFNQRIIEKGFYTKDICNWIIKECEDYSKYNGGWTKKRHRNYPTVDLPLVNIKNILPFFKESLHSIVKCIMKMYCLENMVFNAYEPFIIKYDMNGQTGLELHQDQSELSVNILLSNNDDFNGGGTYFEDGITVKLDQGDMLIHKGKIKHSGLNITKGKRYVLVIFISIFHSKD